MDFSPNMEQWDINSWITRTLSASHHASLSNHSNGVAVNTSQTASLVRSSSVSGSEPDTSVAKRQNVVAKGKIAKRKSRASKRSATTFIAADPANFRRMVQQVTGVRGQVPVAPMLRPEPHRVFNPFQGCWPTLDSSASMLEHQPHHAVGPTSKAPPTPTGVNFGIDDTNYYVI